MTERPYQHLGLHPVCGVCTYPILKHERVKALFGNDDSTSYRGQTRPFPFPKQGYLTTEVDGFHLCRHPNCKMCTASPEFIPIHYECFEIFRKACILESSDALHRLWTIVAWRNPWRKAPPVYLANDKLPDRDSFERVAQMCGMSWLCGFPPELLQMIQDYSAHTLLWRATSALRLAALVAVTSSECLVKIPLCEIVSWRRGGKPDRVSPPSPRLLPVIRLTIDADGISGVERLPCYPAYTGESQGSFAFIVEQEDDLSGLVAQLKDGLLRLELPPDRLSLMIWNTPAPPKLSECRADPAYLPAWQRFFAIEMNAITGITFFFCGSQLFGVHVHHSKESCAMSTYLRFTPRRRRAVVWIYLPIVKSDPLLVLGTRKKPSSRAGFSILTRTQKVGDIALGPQSPQSFSDQCLGACAPITLVYAEPKEERPVPFFGAYCRVLSHPPKPISVPKAGQHPLGESAYFSWAPLKDISSVEVFYDESGERCRGIMFHYLNGGRRAVGQCRLHVDHVKQFFQPQGLCFRVDTHTSPPNRVNYIVVTYTVEISFEDTKRGTEGWSYRPLDGILKFWFTDASSFITV
ncbi:hypothetical protein F4810DRAFT_700405 [Camillea tinctor]|nr:hypothetical protein F4810DRAFT_700405 [Camillea tinctor]